MELRQGSAALTGNKRVHSLKDDFTLAYIAFLFSLIFNVTIAAVLGLTRILPSGYVLGLVASLFAALPVVLIVIFINYHSSSRSRSVARSIGASAGWLLAALFLPNFMGLLMVPVLALAVFTLLPAGSMAVGIVVADRVWIAWHRHAAQAKQSV